MKKLNQISRVAAVTFLSVCLVACSDSDNKDEKPEELSPYVTKVLEFKPAVGQFTNELPEYKEGDTAETMRQKAEKMLVGKNTGMVSLGGFGGYVVVGFDHTIKNESGLRDFRVKGNSFWADNNPNSGANTRGGSCEPGIIMVAYDANKNGMPDANEWYEIAGSEYNKAETTKNYEITYHRPDPNKAPTIDSSKKWLTDTEYIFWEDNQGNSGYKGKLGAHSQSYFPEWVKEDKITFKGTLLAPNGVNEGQGTAQFWVLYSYAFGYADNAPNTDNESAIDIAWAVDKDGNTVDLPGIDFVKVYTGTNQECGWIGENSTEFAGVEDLHMLNISIPTK